MYSSVRLHRFRRHAVVLSGGVSLVLALATASPDAAAAMPVAAGTHAAAPAGTWNTAQEVAGALNAGGNAQVNSVSCASAGNCAAGGYFNSKPGHQHQHAFVVNEVNGKWGTAQAVPEPKDEFDFSILTLSCGSAGNCSAGGVYFSGKPSSPNPPNHAFIVSEVNGKWGAPEEVTGLAKLDTGGGMVMAISCASAGNCSADGFYLDKQRHTQAFVDNEVNGTWDTAEEAPGTAALNVGGRAEPMAISCASAGNCSADGLYLDKQRHMQAFVANEVNGTWDTAKEVAAALNTGGSAAGVGISCASAGNCSAGGGYSNKPGKEQAFIINELNGKWGTAKEVAAGLKTGGQNGIGSVSCGSAGNCSAAGSGFSHGFIVNEVNGTWNNGAEVPGTDVLGSVSCASAGNCSVGGTRAVKIIHSQAIVANEVNGTWAAPEVVPGMAKLNIGLGAGVLSVSCACVGHCSAGGSYLDKSGNSQAFVVNET